jgi:hypothetical protein
MAETPPPLERPARRDPVLHETMTAIMWISHAVAALAEGRTDLARHMAGLANESEMKALQLADTGKEPHPHG